MLFSAYRRDDFNDPEGFVAQLGVILSDFSEEVILYVTGPRTGIQRRSKWPPTVSEIVEACEDHKAYLHRIRTARPAVAALRLSAPHLRDMPQGSLANVFIPDDHPRYEKLCEWAKTAEKVWWKFGAASDGRLGIWIPLNIWQSSDGATRQ